MIKKAKSHKDLKCRLNFSWTYTIEKEIHKGSSYYIIRVNELPGICTDSKNLNEGMQEIHQLIACAMEIQGKKERRNCQN